MAEFSIDPKGVEKLEEEALEKAFDERKGDIARLMGIVAPSCRRMTLVCRWGGTWNMRFLCADSSKYFNHMPLINPKFGDVISVFEINTSTLSFSQLEQRVSRHRRQHS